MKHWDPFASWYAEKQKLLADDKDLPRLPVIEISDADPPAFLHNGSLIDHHRGNNPVEKLDDCIDVESWLGCYNTDENRITIWRRGVELASRRIRCEYKDLLDLVFAHELGHWFHDKAETPDGVSWDRAALVNATKEYNEAWAQWFTWLYAKEHGEHLCKVFEDLEKTQSPPYRDWYQGAFSKKECSEKYQKQCLQGLAKLRVNARKASAKVTITKKTLYRHLLDLDEETDTVWGDFLEHI